MVSAANGSATGGPVGAAAVGTTDLNLPARAASLNLMARVVSGAADFGLAVLTANVLTTHGRGIYAILSVAATVGVMIISGTETVIAADLIHGRHKEPSCQGVAITIALSSGLVLVPLAVIVSSMTGNGMLAALICTAVVTALVAYSSLVLYISQARGDVLRVSLALVGLSVVPLLCSAAAVVIFKPTVTTLMAAWAVAALLTAALQLQDALRTSGVAIVNAARLAWSVIRRGLGVSLSNALSMLTSRIDVLVVAAVISVSAAGVYSIAVALSIGLLILSRSLLTAMYHSIMTAAPSAVASRLSSALRHSVLVVLLAGCLSVPLVALLAGFVFGHAYSGIWVPYAILVPASACACIVELLRHFLLTRLERQREFIWAMTGMLVANGLLAVAGAAAFGLPGAAASTTIAYALGAVVLVAVCARSLSVPMRALVIPRLSDLAPYWRVLRTRL